MVTHSSLDDFYKRSNATLPDGMSRDIGHFNVFETEKLFNKATGSMPYSRRDFYKISWIRGNSKAEYADKVIDIPHNALLFATPKIPYHWLPEDGNHTGMFCIFTPGFLDERKAGVLLDELPIFQPGQVPVFQLSAQEVTEVEYLFRKMHKELATDYAFKYDLLRNLLLELIHFGQKLQPVSVHVGTQNASQRIATLFIELLERQFPLETPRQVLELRTPKDYADRLAVHVNHLNKVLKEIAGITTSTAINNRKLQEARVLLKQTSWTMADIAWSLGFDDVPHFSNFFKKHTALTPAFFRAQ